MLNYLLKISYDGTRYNGWQIQNSTDNTIQGKLTDILKKLSGHDVDVIGSGRTDAGVHALEQVANVHLDLPIDRIFPWNNQNATNLNDTEFLFMYINHYLPKDIAVNNVSMVEDDFHARFRAKKKTYRYRIHRSAASNVFDHKQTYEVLEDLDIEAMKKAASHMIGTKDFKCFCGNKKMKKSTERTVYDIVFHETEDELSIEFTGSGFLQNMVRIMTGTLIEVGIGKIDADDIPRIIESQNRELAGMTAPALGLTLVSVVY